MSARSTVHAGARAAHAAFFLTAAAYAFLVASPFAYEQFIKPSVLPALTDFVRLSPILFWLMWLIALWTLMPQLSAGRRSAAAVSFVVAMAIAAIAVSVWKPLAAIDGGRRALVTGLSALLPLVSLTAVDYRTRGIPALARSDNVRALAACLTASLVVWLAYAAGVPFRLHDVSGVDLTGRALVMSLAVALAADLLLFMVVFLVATMAIRGAMLLDASPLVEYWSLVAALGIGVTLVLYSLVCRALSFTGGAAWTASAAVGVGVAAAWADLALVRTDGRAEPTGGDEPIEALDFFFAPIAGRGSRAAALTLLATMPVTAYWLARAVRQLDWDFLLQKLGVLVVCGATLAACHAATRGRSRRRAQAALAVVPAAVIGLAVGVPSLSVGAAASGYEALDPSFRLLRDVRVARSSETVEYYRYLREHTLVAPSRIEPIEIDFVRPLGASAVGAPPHIFLLVVDSLRRDYISVYNPAVTFTPNIARLAADSDVFERAFTRYAGTYLSVQSLWEGGLPFHASDVAGFDRRNTLRKLLAANRYQPIMTRDHVVEELLPETADAIVLERGRKQMDKHLCPAVDELEPALAARDHARPIFFWSLPQDAHISVMTDLTVPESERHPGFFDKAAFQIGRVDACVGRFVDLLKRANLYDDSIIMLTADHGDLYGVEGRWGHANLVYPDVMRVPLIVHVPPRLRRSLEPATGEVAFLTDVTPTLYRLLGYAPSDLGPLFGRSLYASADAPVRSRRDEDFLVASSYGAVYGIISQNGRRMYVVDTMEGREYVADMSGASPRTFEPAPDDVSAGRDRIRRDIDRLSALYHFQP